MSKENHSQGEPSPASNGEGSSALDREAKRVDDMSRSKDRKDDQAKSAEAGQTNAADQDNRSRIAGLNGAGLSFGLIVLSSVALAAPPHDLAITPAEHAACDGDAANLCADAYPDQDRLVACMKDKRHQLSPACAMALTAGLKKRHMPL